jgi:hypothetical protein
MLIILQKIFTSAKKVVYTLLLLKLEDKFMINIIIKCKIKLLIFLGCFLTLIGCSTLNDVIDAENSGKEGTTKTYAVNQDQAWDIAKKVFRCEGGDAIEEHRSEGYMLTSSGMNLVSVGTVMGAWIKPIDKDTTKVTVVTKRRLTLNVATTLTEGTFQKRFAQEVAIIQSGQPLPQTCPK